MIVKWCFSLDEDVFLLHLKDGFSPETEFIYVGSLKVKIDASEREKVAQKLLEDFNCAPTLLPHDLHKSFIRVSQASTCFEMNMASSTPDMPAMHEGLFIQPSAIQQQLNLPSSSPPWLSCCTHFLLSLLLWLEIYCFQLNFWILLWLSVSIFEKSIFRTLLVTKIRILINLLPLSSRQAFSLFSFIFNYFLLFSIDFLDFSWFSQAWINFIIPNHGIHGINSCKIN